MRNRQKRAFLAANPTCCFCGGVAAAQEPDHQPSRSLFPESQGRPKALIFPACRPCNDHSRKAESKLGLIFPRASEDPADRLKFRAHVGAHAQWRPELIRAMVPDNRLKRQLLRDANVTLPEGTFLDDLPLLALPVEHWQRDLETFAHKLLLALHYRYAGTPLSLNGRLWYNLFTNFSRAAGTLPPDLNHVLDAAAPDPAISIPNELDIGHIPPQSDFTGHGYAVSIRNVALLIGFSSEDPALFNAVPDSELLGPLVHAKAA